MKKEKKIVRNAIPSNYSWNTLDIRMITYRRLESTIQENPVIYFREYDDISKMSVEPVEEIN